MSWSCGWIPALPLPGVTLGISGDPWALYLGGTSWALPAAREAWRVLGWAAGCTAPDTTHAAEENSWAPPGSQRRPLHQRNEGAPSAEG